jgi:hypothetical protein
MWLMQNDGFISAVLDPSDPTGQKLIIRARMQEHLENQFPNKEIIKNAGTDYKYRIFITKQELADLMVERIMDINYTNFKNSVGDDRLHDMYADIWTVGYRYQR